MTMKVAQKVTRYTVSVPEGTVLESKSISMGHTEVQYRWEVLYITVSVPQYADEEHETQVQVMGRRVGKRGNPVRGAGVGPLHVSTLIRHESGGFSERDEVQPLREEALAAVQSFERGVVEQ